MPLKPLRDDLYMELVNIYKRSKSYIQTFYIKDQFATQMVWPETFDDFDWICKNILNWFGLTKKDCTNLDYGNPDHQNRKQYSVRNPERMKGFLNFTYPPYQPSAINFIRYTQEYCLLKKHVGQTNSKIIIPCISGGQASISFPDYNEVFSYSSPVLLDISQTHEVINLQNLKKNGIQERVLFNLVLNKSFSHYCKILPPPLGW